MDIDCRIPKSAFESKAIDLVMKREHNPAAIGMLQLHMAALAVNLHKTHSQQGAQNLPAGQKRKLHSVRAMTSWDSSCSNSRGDGSR